MVGRGTNEKRGRSSDGKDVYTEVYLFQGGGEVKGEGEFVKV